MVSLVRSCQPRRLVEIMRYEVRNLDGKWIIWNLDLCMPYATEKGVLTYTYQDTAQAGADYLNWIHPR